MYAFWCTISGTKQLSSVKYSIIDTEQLKSIIDAEQLLANGSAYIDAEQLVTLKESIVGTQQQ